MTRSATPKRIILITGLLLLALGVLLTPATVAAVGAALGVPVNLGGGQGAARIWLLKLIFITMGLPLLVYRLRTITRLRWLFDLSIGLVLLVVTLLAIEGVFALLNSRRPPAAAPGLSTQFSAPYVEPDPDLGYVLKPSIWVTATQTAGDTIIYQRIYTTDALRRRLTPVENPTGRQQFALFFGGSFTFGDGLPDDATLPAAFGRAAPGVMPYNYGASGYGPQHMLAQFQNWPLPAQVSQAEGVAIYTFICPHVNRAIGSMDVINTWGSSMPYYRLEGNQLVRRGDFVSGRPVLATVYSLLGMSQTVAYFGLQIPRLTEAHYALTARIVAEAAAEFERQFGSNQFYVLLYPDSSGCAGQIQPQLTQLGLRVLDYSTLISREQANLWQPDGHPTAAAQQIVAGRLARDLQLSPAGAAAP